MALDRMVAPSNQQRLVDPYQQRVFQYDTESSDVFLSRVVNSLYRVFGNNICIWGFDITDAQVTHTDEDVMVTVSDGGVIQDTTLLEFPEETTVMMENLSGLDPDGRIVVYVRYQFLHTIEDNKAYVMLNYISKTGRPLFSWNQDTDLTVIGILSFTKDTNDHIIAVAPTDEEFIMINDKQYYLYGFDPARKGLEKLLLHMTSKSSGSTIEWDDGLSLKNDVGDAGPHKFYGTDANGSYGYFDIPTELLPTPINFSWTSLDDTPDHLGDIQGYFIKVKEDGSGLEGVYHDIPSADDFVSINIDQLIGSNKIFGKNVLILGDLTVRGDVTSINQTTIDIETSEIILNRGEIGNGVSANFSGLRVKRGTLPDALLRFNEFNDKWTVGFDGDTTFESIVTGSYVDQGTTPAHNGNKYEISVVNGNLIFSEQI